MAYVGTFSSPLRDTLPTQVDLPPGNGRGIHHFTVDRTTGALTPAGVTEMGTSPGCLAINAAGTRLYSSNETDRAGDDKQGTVSAFGINRSDGRLELLNTVRSGGAGPTYISVHPGGRHLLVANYHGGSVAVLPIADDGRLAEASDVKTDAGTVGPARAPHAPPGSFAFSGHDRTHAHMIQADPSGRFVIHTDLGLDRIDVWKFDARARRAHAERSAFRRASAGRRPAALLFPPERPLALLDPGRGLDARAVRLRRRLGPTDGASDDLDAAARFCRQQLLLGDPGVRRWAVRVRRQPAPRQHRDLRHRPGRHAEHSSPTSGHAGTTPGASPSIRRAASSIAATSVQTTSPCSASIARRAGSPSPDSTCR